MNKSLALNHACFKSDRCGNIIVYSFPLSLISLCQNVGAWWPSIVIIWWQIANTSSKHKVWMISVVCYLLKCFLLFVESLNHTSQIYWPFPDEPGLTSSHHILLYFTGNWAFWNKQPLPVFQPTVSKHWPQPGKITHWLNFLSNTRLLGF